MVYPPAPGTNNLPPRPPPSANSSGGGFNKGGFKPTFGAAQQQQQPASSYPRTSTPTYPGSSASPVPSYGPVAPPPPQAQRPQYGQSSTYSAAYGGGRGAVSAAPYSYPQQPPPQQYQPQAYSAPQTYASAPSYSSAPQIRNPFPQAGPGSGAAAAASDYDPEMAAQIAQWQSAYSSRENPPLDRDGKPIIAAPTSGAEPTKPEQPVSAGANPDKKKTVAREGGGKKWTDDTLLEWDPSHLRLFVGNLAGETTDDSLLKAFSRWGSVQKARVVRDKRSTKSKGFGFVSFSDADDFFQAAKEMNGKYIQSHPVVVRKANTEIKVTTAKDKGRGGKKGGHHSDNKKKHDGGGGGYEPNLGPMGGGGVTKPGQKTKNGLRLLG
jgi:hypothetical protein